VLDPDALVVVTVTASEAPSAVTAATEMARLRPVLDMVLNVLKDSIVASWQKLGFRLKIAPESLHVNRCDQK